MLSRRRLLISLAIMLVSILISLLGDTLSSTALLAFSIVPLSLGGLLFLLALRCPHCGAFVHRCITLDRKVNYCHRCGGELRFGR